MHRGDVVGVRCRYSLVCVGAAVEFGVVLLRSWHLLPLKRAHVGVVTILLAIEAEDPFVASKLHLLLNLCQIILVNFLLDAVGGLVPFLTTVVAEDGSFVHRGLTASVSLSHTSLVLNPILLVGEIGNLFQTCLLVDNNQFQMLRLAFGTEWAEPADII